MIPVDSRRDAGEIEALIKTFAQSPNGGIIFSPNAAALPAGYKLIIRLAARLKLPTVYPVRYMVAEGGLMSYSNDAIEDCRRAAGYVDRILKLQRDRHAPHTGRCAPARHGHLGSSKLYWETVSRLAWYSTSSPTCPLVRP